MDDRGTSNKLYKEVEYAIQLVIDICSIINSDTSKETPSDEDSIFLSLVNNKIISKEIGDKIIEMKGFRNVLVHKYGKINNGEAYENVSQGLKDFERIIEEIEAFLVKSKK